MGDLIEMSRFVKSAAAPCSQRHLVKKGEVARTVSLTYAERNRRAFVARQRAAKELLLKLPRRGVLGDIFGYNQ